MRLDGQFTVNAARPDVYAFLTDPATVSRHMPDVKNVVIEDADHFTVTARVGVSHIKGDVVMKLAIKDRQPPVSTTVVGKGTGLASAVDMVTSFTLDAADTGETVVHWQADVTISGSWRPSVLKASWTGLPARTSTRSSKGSGTACSNSPRFHHLQAGPDRGQPHSCSAPRTVSCVGSQVSGSQDRARLSPHLDDGRPRAGVRSQCGR